MRIERIQDGTVNYLRVSETKSDSYSDKIFSYQEIPGFLPVEVRCINGSREYLYDLSGKISLEQYLKKETFGQKECKKIFMDLIDRMKTLEEYLLDGRNFVIREETLFVDPVTGELSGIYQAEDRKNPVKQMGYLLEYMMDKINQNNTELVFFVYGMHRLTKEEGCTLERMEQYMAKSFSYEQEKDSESQVPGTKEKEDRQNRTVAVPIQKNVFLKEYWLPILIGLLALAIEGILWHIGVFTKPVSKNPDFSKLIGVTCFVVGVSAYGIRKTLPENKNVTDIVVSAQSDSIHKMCLIPQKGGTPLIKIPYFPYEMGKIRITQDDGQIYILNQECEEMICHNHTRVVPWEIVSLEDGDILHIGERSYVTEITC